MKRLGLKTFITLVVVGLFLSGCSDQKPATEKTTQQEAKVESLETTTADIKKASTSVIASAS